MSLSLNVIPALVCSSVGWVSAVRSCICCFLISDENNFNAKSLSLTIHDSFDWQFMIVFDGLVPCFNSSWYLASGSRSCFCKMPICCASKRRLVTWKANMIIIIHGKATWNSKHHHSDDFWSTWIINGQSQAKFSVEQLHFESSWSRPWPPCKELGPHVLDVQHWKEMWLGRPPAVAAWPKHSGFDWDLQPWIPSQCVTDLWQVLCQGDNDKRWQTIHSTPVSLFNTDPEHDLRNLAFPCQCRAWHKISTSLWATLALRIEALRPNLLSSTDDLRRLTWLHLQERCDANVHLLQQWVCTPLSKGSQDVSKITFTCWSGCLRKTQSPCQAFH